MYGYIDINGNVGAIDCNLPVHIPHLLSSVLHVSETTSCTSCETSNSVSLALLQIDTGPLCLPYSKK